ncbi:zinc ribbon domain-containing protein [Natronoglycomyces albus]|uniref:C4-type zinc ribbon domain-containing protein n=1 Tax=Natronoglycomyces albus TaxID=2811108 RepID=A0A895XWG7_9ACTN|nr:C4-type zinc ribbon domain-containing protein [Natronoglycomyces albus]QSB06570.1 hypothetical protein JQS30_06620 [Natronoglycomyces albus]
MKADPFDQRRLLELQATDTAIAQLEQSLKTLPEAERIPALQREAIRLRDQVSAREAGIADLDRDIARVEKEIAVVTKRANNDRDRMAAGSVTPKQLEGLQSELESLANRQNELEDQQLELMETRERLEATLAGHIDQLKNSQAAQQEAERARDAAVAEVDEKIAHHRQQREHLSASIPSSLVELYEKVRAKKPIAAALLRLRSCESCRIEKSPADLAPIRAAGPDEVLRCEECGAILIRTEESGI